MPLITINSKTTIMKKSLILLFSIALMLSACKRNTSDNPTPTVPAAMEDLVVTGGFDWKTSKDVQLVITGKTSNIIEVLSEGGVTYQSAFITANVPYTMKLTVASYEEKIRLKYSGQDIILDLDSENLSYDFQ